MTHIPVFMPCPVHFQSRMELLLEDLSGTNSVLYHEKIQLENLHYTNYLIIAALYSTIKSKQAVCLLVAAVSKRNWRPHFNSIQKNSS
uniref:Uncharacterized protein n=1 Tax=Arundo donax TaxID=35708 RepID=A0A0A9H6S8_ARUDO